MSTAFNVWTPQGNVIPNTVAGGTNTLSNPNVLYDNNSVILFPGSPSTFVFKMWAGINSSSGSSLSTGYFESADGLTNWTAYSSNPVSTGVLPKIFKNAGTYYLYTTGSPGPINVQTSTDGVTFGASASTGLSNGGAGTWNTAIYQLLVLDNVAGTWYAYYNGEDASFNPRSSMGLATSTDLLHWTDAGSNPRTSWITSNWSFLVKANGVYYVYMDAQNGEFPRNSYGTIQRATSATVFGPWNRLEYNGNPVSVFYPTNLADAVTYAHPTDWGDPSIVAANGNVYLYGTAGIVAGVPAQINAAVAFGYTPAQLVATYEGVVNVPIPGAGTNSPNLSVLASDSGTGANANPIAGNWTNLASNTKAQRLSNNFSPGAINTSGYAWWNALTWPNNQWSQVTLQTSLASNNVGVSVRDNESGGITTYTAYQSGGSLGNVCGLKIFKLISGTETTFVTVGNITLDQGDTVTIAANGTGIYVYWNNSIIFGGTDSSITSGAPGFATTADATSAADAAVNNWLGGAFQNAPNPPPIGGGGAIPWYLDQVPQLDVVKRHRGF